MKPITIHLPEHYLDALDELVRKRYYPNRAEAIRMAIRDFIKTETYEDNGGSNYAGFRCFLCNKIFLKPADLARHLSWCGKNRRRAQPTAGGAYSAARG